MFLHKKKNIHFKIEKNCEKKPLFIINRTENLSFNIYNITLNNKTSININNLNNQENILSNKITGEFNKLEKTFPIKEKPKLFYTVDYNLFENPEEEKKNEGRWSYYENIKFIKAFVNFGKNYKLIQKYICSRNKKQIRSHAQKFFKKFKKLKNNDFDFSDDNIKDFSDIFKLIEAKNKNNIEKKEYIINTLISLYENIPKNENNYFDKNNKFNPINTEIMRRKKIEDKVDKTIECPSLNNEKNIKKEGDNGLSKNIFNTEDQMFIFENEINNDSINSNLDLKEDEEEEINQKGSAHEEIDINRCIDFEVNGEKLKKDIFMNEKNVCNYSNVDNNFNRSIKMYNDFIYSVGDSDLFCLDEISSDVNKILYVNKIESPFFNLTSDHLD